MQIVKKATVLIRTVAQFVCCIIIHGELVKENPSLIEIKKIKSFCLIIQINYLHWSTVLT